LKQAFRIELTIGATTFGIRHFSLIVIGRANEFIGYVKRLLSDLATAANGFANPSAEQCSIQFRVFGH
jgi:hypothetical protein